MEILEYRPLAVVTGAASGIGLELARQFAEEGYELVICANDENIFTVQNDLEMYGGNVTALKTDLATFYGVEELYRTTKKLGQPISAIAINTSVGVDGEFARTSLKDEVNLINLNITSVVHLTKKILPDLIEQNEGRILFAGADDSATPAHTQAVYRASRAFVATFAEAIREEVKDTKISITVDMGAVTFKTKLQGWASKILPESFRTH
jgi:short-subunit dehydrogenase